MASRLTRRRFLGAAAGAVAGAAIARPSTARGQEGSPDAGAALRPADGPAAPNMGPNMGPNMAPNMAPNMPPPVPPPVAPAVAHRAADPALRGLVVEVDAPGLVSEDGVVGRAAAARAVDGALTELTGEVDPVTALGRFVRPGDTVGLKVDCMGGPAAVFHPALADRLVEHLQALGVPADRIFIFDQFLFHLVRAGYLASGGETPGGGGGGRRAGVRILHHSSPGAGWDEPPETLGGHRTFRFTSLLTRCTAILNLHAAKDHRHCGVSGALVNMALGCIDNPQAFHDVLDGAVPRIYAHPAIRSRVRLNLCDAAYVLRNGGPQDNPAHRVVRNAVLASADPVAMDFAVIERVERARRQAGLRSLWDVVRPRARPPLHVAHAAALGLGAPAGELRWLRRTASGERRPVAPRHLEGAAEAAP